LAHRVNSRQRSISVAFGAKRTFSELRLQHRIYEHAAQNIVGCRWVLTLYGLRGGLCDRSGSGGNAPMRAATSGGTR